jgi:hypothetical protein
MPTPPTRSHDAVPLRSSPARGTSPVPGRVAVAGGAVFVLATVVAGLLYPGYDPTREGISALASTPSPSAAVMIGGFLALAAGTTAAGVALWTRLRGSTAGRVGAVLVLLAGAGMIVAGLARQDCSELIGACAAAERSDTLTGHHVLHQLVSLAVFAALILALFVLPRGLRRTPWARMAGPTRLAGVAALVVLLALIGGATGDVGGLVQRVFVALAFGWPVLLAALPGRTALP